MILMEKEKNTTPPPSGSAISYISKGICRQRMRDGCMAMESRGEEHILSADLAAIWSAGKESSAESPDGESLRRLEEMNLIETTPRFNDVLDAYHLLTRCVICPTEDLLPFAPKETRRTLRWIRNAGLRLTMAELVRIAELKLESDEEYLGAKNRQALVEVIYCADNIEDGVLESLMEKSKELVSVVDHVLTLLQAGHIRLL